MTARDEQEAAEQAVFIEFAETVPLAFNSIESRRPPELGAVINEALERAINEQRGVRRQFQTAYSALRADDRRCVEEC